MTYSSNAGLLYRPVTVLLILSLTAACATGEQPAGNAASTAAANPATTENGADRQLLMNSIRIAQCDVVSATLEKGLDPNFSDAFGYTPLTLAAVEKHMPCVQALLKHGADVNGAITGGWTPLIGAAMAGASAELIDVLLDKGADVNARNQWGCTALYYAAGYGAERTVDHLIKRGAAVPGTAGACMSPTRIAEMKGFPKVIERLKQAEKPQAQTAP